MEVVSWEINIKPRLLQINLLVSLPVLYQWLIFCEGWNKISMLPVFYQLNCVSYCISYLLQVATTNLLKDETIDKKIKCTMYASCYTRMLRRLHNFTRRSISTLYNVRLPRRISWYIKYKKEGFIILTEKAQNFNCSWFCLILSDLSTKIRFNQIKKQIWNNLHCKRSISDNYNLKRNRHD